MIKLSVSGFPLENTEMELAMLIAPHGDITTLKIVLDKKTRKCKGYTFVEMLTDDGAVKASVALDGLAKQDRELTVKISEKAPQPPRHFAPARPTMARPNASSDSRLKRPRKQF